MTGNLLLPGGGGNTAALQKQEIDALIAAGDVAGDHWDRSAGALSPKVSTDNVDIGNGKTTLNADGTAEFSYYVRVGDYGNDNGANINPKGAITLKKTDGLDAQIRGELSGTTTFKVLGNGNATFAGNVTSTTTPTGAGIYVSPDSTGANPVAIRIVDSGSNPKTSLLADGGANFASQQFRIASSGETTIDSPAVAAGSNIFSIKTALNSGNEVASIKADGTAAFAGSVLSGNTGLNTYGFDINISDGTNNVAQYVAGSGLYIGNIGSNNLIGNSAIQLGESGSASFAGMVRTRQATNGTPSIYATCNDTSGDTASIVADNSAGGNCFVAKNAANSQIVWKVRSDGTTTFAGTVTSANSFAIQLEADDETKYTTDVDEEGNETQTYNGATLDVKESIETATTARLAMRETFQELLVAVQSATDFGQLKAAMLVALEDYA